MRSRRTAGQRRAPALLPHRLHDESLVPLPVELGVEHPLPGPEVEAALGDGNDDLVMNEHRLEVGVPVVPPGPRMRVVGAERRELLEPLPDVLVQPALVVVHEHPGRDVHRAHEHEPPCSPLRDRISSSWGVRCTSSRRFFVWKVRYSVWVRMGGCYAGFTHRDDSNGTWLNASR